MRKIIHLDMDAFYASVELRERPELKDLPVVIASHHPRAVVAAASYPARVYGLRSAMSMGQARKLCPQVIVIEPDFAKYRQVSAQIHQIFQQYTSLIEPLSLDEAFLDVTENLKQIPSATEVAMRIREDIFQATGLTASAGVAPNKFLAKIASDWYKPNGICVIKPSQVQRFIQDLPLKKIPGVGKVTQEKLKSLNLETLGDLQQIDEALLIQHFGKYGRRLFLYAQGIDERPVEVERERQQISKETTFDDDLHLNQCRPYWEPLLGQVWQSLQKKQLSARGVTVKLKLKNFQVMQHSKSFKQVLRSPQELAQALDLLLDDLHIAPQMQFRLIGVGVYQLSVPETETQLLLL
ncbi:DNA polymerase IV [Acinetobacter lwoffii]|uniref:DNA polymerase IV n=1 Tax=Acinetobacter lwoffii NCTC 5866 = CIP 64.10 = NIPH 512 TaxID=981327 RepID=A0ABP2ZB85_ACILW|nr:MULTISPECIES: DNA polymerase IV [Acinetobacter]ENU17673.1 DNA polymerase IV [Acinetobacter sp. CIP A162]ESJ94655.1 DNA polymerase IV [Acinetobacter lwoffii NCTC 5866 = CIP 64.10 = NIPH 512]QXB39178.1 DNA polymerase IV [Acinetobacter lwoffii]SUU34304.1 DNA polymerase IV [Acinetobacter lwoffii]VFQ41007.1 DNA polymerase IV [Acinetobacter lwoffii]